MSTKAGEVQTDKEWLNSNCHSKNDKVWFVFGNRTTTADMPTINGFAQSRNKTIHSSGGFGNKCKDQIIEKSFVYGICQTYVSSTSKNISKFWYYIFRKNYYNISFGEIADKEESDPSSLLPIMKKALFKLK